MHVRQGCGSAEIIAMREGLDVAEVEPVVGQVVRRVDEERTHVDVLRTNLKTLQELVDVAVWEYRGRPHLDNSQSLTMMLQTSMSLIKEIEKQRDPAETLNEILARVVQPLLREFIKQLTAEAARCRDSLCDALPETAHETVDREIKEAVKSLGGRLRDDYGSSVRALIDVLGCKPEDEKIRPMLQVIEGGDVEKDPAANDT